MGNPNINYMIAQEMTGKTVEDISHKKKKYIDKGRILLAARVTSQKGRNKRALSEMVFSAKKGFNGKRGKEAKYSTWVISNLILLDSTLEHSELNKIAIGVLMSELAETMEE